MALTPEQRRSQQVIGGIIRAGFRFDKERIWIWREEGCGEWKADATEVLGHLLTLQIPFEMSRTRGDAKSTARSWGFRFSFERDDLSDLMRWVPKLRKIMEKIEAAELAATNQPDAGAPPPSK